MWFHWRVKNEFRRERSVRRKPSLLELKCSVRCGYRNNATAQPGASRHSCLTAWPMISQTLMLRWPRQVFTGYSQQGLETPIARLGRGHLTGGRHYSAVHLHLPPSCPLPHFLLYKETLVSSVRISQEGGKPSCPATNHRTFRGGHLAH